MSAVKNRVFSVILSAFCVFALIAAFFPQSIHAAGDKSLKLICVDGDDILAGMQWRIFKVGERKDNKFVLTGEFAKSSASLAEVDKESVNAAAKTLEAFVLSESISPLAEGKTDKNGEKLFDSLETGIYLALGTQLTQNYTTYIPTPLVIEVGQENAVLDYDAYPKFIAKDTYSMKCTVKKKWLGDEENLRARPGSVTVELYRDEVLFDTVILTEADGWQYDWKDNERGHIWKVAEIDVPYGYEVSIDYNDSSDAEKENQFLIKNIYKTTTTTTTTVTTTTTTSSSDETTTTGTETAVKVTKTTTANTTTGVKGTTSSTTSGSSSSVTTSTPTGGKVPQTGQLWWPVIPLSIGGIFFIAAGFMVRPKRNKSDAE